ncbi:hypothetical protein BH10ACI4_BH10ACI4_15030 [soil metagenome]
MQVKMTQGEFDAVASRLKSSQGIELNGPQGTIEKMGVKASYAYDGQTLTVDLLEKPFLVTREYVEEKFKEWLA